MLHECAWEKILQKAQVTEIEVGYLGDGYSYVRGDIQTYSQPIEPY